MIKALVSVNMDLSSGIALRYAHQLADLIRARLQTIHVETSDAGEKIPSMGWVRNKWENSLVEKGQSEIARFLNTGHLKNLAVWGNPIVRMGDPEDIISRELLRGQYELYLQGVLLTCNVSDFYDLLNSRLFRVMTCPAVLVRNLVELNDILLLVENRADVMRFLPKFIDLFGQTELNIDFMCYDAEKAQSHEIQETHEDLASGEVQKLLSQHGKKLRHQSRICGSPEQLGKRIRDYGLVVSSVRRPVAAQTPMLELLGQVVCPILLFWH